MARPKTLLGSHLEGGGQIIRNALCLSALLLQPLNLTEIRGGRPRGGGLGHQHLCGVLWLSQATASATTGAEKGSKTLEFWPVAHQKYWKEHARGRMVEIDIGTPGAVTLVLQTVLPYMLFTAGGEGDSLEVAITGGTNVSNSPSVDYVQQVLFPIPNERVLPEGCPRLQMEVEKRCWGSGKGGLGKVLFAVPVLRPGEKLRPLRMVERGEVVKVVATVLVPAQEQLGFRKQLEMALAAEGIEVEIVLHPDSGSPKRLYLLLVAHTSTGCRLGSDALYDSGEHKKSGKSKAEYMVEKCVERLRKELKHGGCVDEFAQDQLVVFQALAEGGSSLRVGEIKESLHTQTAKWVVSTLCGREFSEDGNVDGIGFSAGE
jgi:RNA 3'-terminal phosphate cyclase (ATP)